MQRWQPSGGVFYSAKGGTIYVARVNGAGDPRMARPCDNCYEVLADAGVRKIIYTANETFFKMERIRG